MSNSTASGVDSVSSTSQFTSSPFASSTSTALSTTTSQVTSQSSTLASSTPTRTTATPTPTTPTTTTPDSTPISTAVITFTPTSNGSTLPATTETITSTESPNPATGSSSTSSSPSSSSSGTAGLVSNGSNNSGSSGLSGAGKIAVAVVVPIVAVALIVIALIFLWRKRKQRKDAEELRRKEVEEYGYNPNNDPTLPAVGVVSGGAAGHDGPFEMREEGSSGYRGWGTTAVGSSGRKASTTLSGGNSGGGIGMAYSEETSPTHGPVSDTRSGDPLVGSSPNGRPLSGGSEVLGAMGPATSSNRNDDMHRGPSNASSSYSAANRSDGSGEAGVPGGALGAAQYYSNDQYGNTNPYTETSYGSPPGRAEMSGQPVIRDVQARRNTRIENPSHFPQQSAGISQNF